MNLKLTDTQKQHLSKLPKLEQIATIAFLENINEKHNEIEKKDKKVKQLHSELKRKNALGIAKIEETYILEAEITLLQRLMDDLESLYKNINIIKREVA